MNFTTMHTPKWVSSKITGKSLRGGTVNVLPLVLKHKRLRALANYKMRKDRITYHIQIICLDKADAVEVRELNRNHLRKKAKQGLGDGISILSHRELPNGVMPPSKVPSPSNQKAEVAL